MKNTADETAALEEGYRTASPRSKEYFERAQKVMPGGVKGAYFYQPYPISMERGEGCYLYDVDGRRFVDFTNHHTAQILGHNHPSVNSAVAAQLERGIALGAPTGIEVELAEEMCGRVSSLDSIRFCNSGTEATLHAVRLARGFTGRPKIAKFEGAYHGSHDAVEISVSPPLEDAGPDSAPNPVASAGGIAPHATDEIVILPYNDEAAVERLIADHRNELACVLFDPKPHAITQRKEFVQFLQEILRKNDILFILDEIVSFRVAPGGFQECFGINPDLTTYGKIIGGGFPVGGLGGRAEVMDLFDNSGRGRGGLFQSGTFSGHPVVMAAGLAMLKQLTPDAFAHLDQLGDQVRDGLTSLFARKGINAQMAGMGSLFSIHFIDGEIRNYRDLVRKDNTLPRVIFLSLLDQGYFLNTSLEFNALSLPMESHHVEGLIEAVEHAIEQLR